MRIDQLLVERGLASSRSQAQRLIAAGVRWRVGETWKAVAKNGDEVPLDAQVELLDLAEARYVSRGGLKLEAALKDSGVQVAGKACLDIGQSTGGFTDCLLQQGAAQVVGVDVGSGQLHAKLRSDPRVVCIESVNARQLSATDLIADYADGQPAAAVFPLITGDLSFISLTLVLPALVPFLADGGDLLMLVKPQFELQPENIGKHGLVKDPADYAVVEKRLRDACAALGLKVIGWHDSAITGGDGNREFFIHAKKM
ncbi:MAG: TlyA family RNA methyltransferase [Burkholderiales bacterium]|nr:TlyA family RNA methyltransferase [Burkholderiales bacterium]